MSNLRYEISRFVTAVTNLVKKEYCTAMLHGGMNLSRNMVYAQYIQQSKISRIFRHLKRVEKVTKTNLG